MYGKNFLMQFQQPNWRVFKESLNEGDLSRTSTQILEDILD